MTIYQGTLPNVELLVYNDKGESVTINADVGIVNQKGDFYIVHMPWVVLKSYLSPHFRSGGITAVSKQYSNFSEGAFFLINKREGLIFGSCEGLQPSQIMGLFPRKEFQKLENEGKTSLFLFDKLYLLEEELKKH